MFRRYVALPVHSISDSLLSYQKSVDQKVCTRPVPPYVEDSISATKDSTTTTSATTTESISIADNNGSSRTNTAVFDTCYHLIKLYCDEKHTIESTIATLTHTSNQLDFRLRFVTNRFGISGFVSADFDTKYNLFYCEYTLP
jgi:hypothetical protein